MTCGYFVCSVPAVPPGGSVYFPMRWSTSERPSFHYHSLFQLRQNPPQGNGAVADGVFLRRGQLRRGAAVLREVKQRVVPEAVFPRGDARYLAVKPPLRFHTGAVRAREHDGAGVVRAAVRLARELFEQETVIRLVVAVPPAKARREDTGRAVERVDTDAAVVGQRAAAG